MPETNSIDTATGNSAPPDLSTDRVKGIFSFIAPKYSAFNAASSLGAYKLWLSKMAKMANVSHSETVLDVAGGTGDVTFKIARSSAPKHIVCTDLVLEMLDIARARYASGRAKGVPVSFEVVDAQDMPFQDESFDVVTMAYGLRNMPKRERALSEIFRVLKPGGRLVCLDFSTPRNAAWRSLYELYLHRAVPMWGRLITGDASGFVYLSNSIDAFPDQAGIAKMMEDAGFANVDWKNCTGGIACIHVAIK